MIGGWPLGGGPSLSIVNTWPTDVPPPGAGVNTVTLAVPALAMSPAVIVAWVPGGEVVADRAARAIAGVFVLVGEDGDVVVLDVVAGGGRVGGRQPPEDRERLGCTHTVRGVDEAAPVVRLGLVELLDVERCVEAGATVRVELREVDADVLEGEEISNILLCNFFALLCNFNKKTVVKD